MRPRRRRLDAAARRASILEAAIPVFATVGYEQTRMSDVAARIGVTEPVIFQNFGTKAELFAAALDRVSEQAAAHLTELAVKHETVDVWLRHLLDADHLDHLHTAPMFGVLFEDAHRLQFEAAVAAAFHRNTARVAEGLASILKRGQAEGAIRNDVSALSLAWLVVSLIQARQFRRRFSPESSSSLERELLDRIVDTLRRPQA
ncbi:MAG: helix-turn-helix transcriptional regulator [Chloroflexi bacterium]|nr:helix-turn-helix transcriptional regulator [Chloroflexota bacterium]